MYFATPTFLRTSRTERVPYQYHLPLTLLLQPLNDDFYTPTKSPPYVATDTHRRPHSKEGGQRVESQLAVASVRSLAYIYTYRAVVVAGSNIPASLGRSFRLMTMVCINFPCRAVA